MSPSNPNQQTILFLAANPKDTGRLRLDQELRDIAEGLQRAQKRDHFNLEQRLAVRSRDIQRAMLDVSPKIIHFSGHGEGEQGLVFEDEIGNAKLVDGAALAGLFELFADQINCVVLNGCYSEVQARAIAQHIPYVVGMNQSIGDKAAIAFAIGFYDALGAGRDTEFAYSLGCNAIHLEGILEYLTPIIYCKGVKYSDSDLQLNRNSKSIQEDESHKESNPKEIDSRDTDNTSISQKLNSLTRIVHGDDLWLRSILEVPFFEPLFELIKQDRYWDWKERLLIEVSSFPYAHQLTPLEASKLICKLTHQIKPSSPWEIRRAIGNCLGETWSYLHPKVASKEVNRISEEISFKWESQILIATAIGKANLLIEQDQIISHKLLSAEHPQVRWQIAKEWDILQQNDSFNSLLEDSDNWVLKRFIISTLNTISKDPKQLSEQVKKVVSKHLTKYLSSAEGTSFLKLLDLWLCKSYDFSFLQECLPEPLTTVNSVRQFSGNLHYKLHRFVEDPQKLATSLDLLCLDIELALPSTSKPLGRYETIFCWVSAAVEEAYLFGNLPEVFAELMNCHDEGIRWAVAHSLPHLFEMKTHLFYEISYKLLQDENNWTVSETLRNLCKIKEIEANELVKLAKEAHSWIKSMSLLKGLDYVHEVQVAFSELLDHHPQLREKFRILIDSLL